MRTFRPGGRLRGDFGSCAKAFTLSESLKKENKRADQVAAHFEATELAGLSTAEAAQDFGRLRWISPEKLDLTPKPAKAFHNRFAAIDKARSGFSPPTPGCAYCRRNSRTGDCVPST